MARGKRPVARRGGPKRAPAARRGGPKRAMARGGRPVANRGGARPVANRGGARPVANKGGARPAANKGGARPAPRGRAMARGGRPAPRGRAMARGGRPAPRGRAMARGGMSNCGGPGKPPCIGGAYRAGGRTQSITSKTRVRQLQGGAAVGTRNGGGSLVQGRGSGPNGGCSTGSIMDAYGKCFRQ